MTKIKTVSLFLAMGIGYVCGYVTTAAGQVHLPPGAIQATFRNDEVPLINRNGTERGILLFSGSSVSILDAGRRILGMFEQRRVLPGLPLPTDSGVKADNANRDDIVYLQSQIDTLRSELTATVRRLNEVTQ
jgi:hypothetical protein